MKLVLMSVFFELYKVLQKKSILIIIYKKASQDMHVIICSLGPEFSYYEVKYVIYLYTFSFTSYSERA